MFPGRAGSQNLAAHGQTGEPGGGIDRIADDRKLYPFRGADIAQEDLARKIKTNIYFFELIWKSCIMLHETV